MLVIISMMYHQDICILNCFQVTELQNGLHCILFLAFFTKDLTPRGRLYGPLRKSLSRLTLELCSVNDLSLRERFSSTFSSIVRPFKSVTGKYLTRFADVKLSVIFIRFSSIANDLNTIWTDGRCN